jgi:hypothetical protein
MLHNCHELNGVVSQPLDPRQYIRSKLLIRPYPHFRCRNTDVFLVDPHILRLWRTGILGNRIFKRRGIPESSFVYGRNGEVLGDTFDPSRQTFDTLTRGNNYGDLEYLTNNQLASWKILNLYFQLGIVRDRTHSRRFGMNLMSQTPNWSRFMG